MFWRKYVGATPLQGIVFCIRRQIWFKICKRGFYKLGIDTFHFISYSRFNFNFNWACDKRFGNFEFRDLIMDYVFAYTKNSKLIKIVRKFSIIFISVIYL